MDYAHVRPLMNVNVGTWTLAMKVIHELKLSSFTDPGRFYLDINHLFSQLCADRYFVRSRSCLQQSNLTSVII